MKTFPVDKISELFSFDGGYLYNKILDTVTVNGMSASIENGVLIGLSGGADSVLLLCFLYEYRRRSGADFSIVACHVNHMIRDGEADRDEEFSRSLTNSLGIEFISEKVDVPKYADSRGLGLEEAARDVRYSIFAEIVGKRDDVSFIAVAHNASDNLETVIFNLMRGAGLGGASGIAPVRDNIIRPMIRLSKDEIISYLDRCGIGYVTDSTNVETEYTRNYIRHEIVPKLKRLTPSPEAVITRFTDFARMDNEYINGVADEAYGRILKNGRISLDDLKALDSAVLHRVLSRFAHDASGFSLDSKHISLIKEALSIDNTSVSIGGGFSFVIERGVCSVTRDDSPIKDERIYSLTRGMNMIDGYQSILFFGDSFDFSIPEGYKIISKTEITPSSIEGDVILRFRSEGDCYRYGGMTHKLKKVFNDRNIPPTEREGIPVICDTKGILWVAGLPPRDSSLPSSGDDKISLILLMPESDVSDRKIYTARQR